MQNNEGMNTLIRKQHRFGFFVAEHDIRRVHQLMNEAAAKVTLGDAFKTHIEVRLVNGTVLVLSSIDELLALENGGQRSVDELCLCVHSPRVREFPDDAGDTPQWLISLTFRTISRLSHYEYSVASEVRGTSRDWVLLVASEIEERVQKLRRIAWQRALERPYVAMFIMVLALFIIGFTISAYEPAVPIHAQLDSLYKAGRITDPVQALVFIEKSRALRPLGNFLMQMSLAVGLVFGLAFGLPKLAEVSGSSYVFYWGDAIAAYDRRRSAAFIFWTVVVLGLLVGLGSTYLGKQFGW